MVKIAVLGYGTVGSGVVEVLRTNQKVIDERLGEELRIKYVLDLRDFPDDPVQELITHDFEDIVNDDEVKIVVEVMGGIEPAYTFVKRSLEAGKSVATSNKALVAKHGAELLRTAKEKNVNFLFEASVGGGIPILRPLHSSLTGDVIEEITGILNGTTNYMMTKMFYEGADYDEVLEEAQDNGFAERNPEADVEGYDACRKIAILSSIISGKQVDFEDIYCEGITKITAEDMKYAKAMGMTIKLLATCKRDGGKLNAMVAPCLLRAEHPLFSVNGVFNSIFVHGNMLGDAMFYGSGAGKLPTASAVVGDIVEEARNLDRNLGVMWSSEKLTLEDRRDVERRFFVRVKGDREELQEQVAAVFGMVQFVQAEGLSGEFGFVTEEMPEGSYEEKAERFGGQILGMIRVEE
ncbi:homoserine dehydrogenase [Faecalicatena contorta]|uniref:Homoserine dehydrogenase n=1 Tax=Faecalicatena fissicatena TaxID=290055 RepID=A0ABS2E6R0_9FIRM|nr:MULTISPECIES: homoserine dehydrogenase [Faecalicatena]MBM6685209.1 homoserine dehydrogenase [Faecalicatena contorta]MBM6710754.1 homoserine dehydrogenase [Faecalicatena contorta]MBM6737314.1 homoserine dehydrogenase [Faecalicatena fissicatena]HIX98722.1 homoserine dehydrogenase [Candidatus Dorea intestinigallinarum]